MDIGRVKSGIPLNGGNQASDPTKIAEAARQLETQFARMLITSMRTTSLGDSMFPGSSSHYRDMYDQQLAGSLTRGKGLGLQDAIRRQLGGDTATQAPLEQPAKTYAMDGYRKLLPGRQAEALSAWNGLPLQRGAAAALPLSASDRAAAAGSGVAAKVMAQLNELLAATSSGEPTDGDLPLALATLQQARAQAQDPRLQASATADCDGMPQANARPGSPEAFVAKIWPHAQRAAAELGVCPKVLVAQAALETGWGRHTISSNGSDANNLFGIKAGSRWSGQAVNAVTSEYRAGAKVQENAAFRAYRSVADSFNDYVALLKNSPRYAAALGQSTARAFAGALQRAGYATDPQYAAKLTAIAEGPTLSRALAQLSPPTA